MMSFNAFLTHATGAAFWHENRVICFITQDYPSLFFNQLFVRCQEEQLLPGKRMMLDAQEHDIQKITGMLMQRCLGVEPWYWFADSVDHMSAKTKERLARFLLTDRQAGYRSLCLDPNTVALVEKDLRIGQYVVLDGNINRDMFSALHIFFGGQIDAKFRFLSDHIFTITPHVTLDQACMLMQYCQVMSAKKPELMSGYLERVLDINPSLSVLSEHFFSGNSQAFFALWDEIKDKYPAVFWTVFWSEQMWRAHHVVLFLAQENFVAAKRMGYRLPYSFLNRHWKRYKGSVFLQAYDFLYSLDYRIKHGGQAYGLEVFYGTFLNSSFSGRGL